MAKYHRYKIREDVVVAMRLLLSPIVNHLKQSKKITCPNTVYKS